jgi:hypothetical protein
MIKVKIDYEGIEGEVVALKAWLEDKQQEANNKLDDPDESDWQKSNVWEKVADALVDSEENLNEAEAFLDEAKSKVYNFCKEHGIELQ